MTTAVLAQPKEIDEIDYPESDGKPVAETPIHFNAIVSAYQHFEDRYRDDPFVMVAANNFCYYKKGDASAQFSPDVYVVFGVPKKPPRHVYKIWEEKEIPPRVIFEFSSRSTKDEDLIFKMNLYEKLGVKEYFLFDPENDYLKPPLQGYRLRGGRYRLIAAEPDGTLGCREMKLKVRIAMGGELLEFIDTETGEKLLSHEEARRAAEEKTRRAQEVARQSQESEQRAKEARNRAESELARLRAELARLKNPPPSSV